MGAGAKGFLLAGDCLVVPQRSLTPFKEFCIHTLGSSPALATYPDSGLFGCGSYISTPGTQLLPDPRIPEATTPHPSYGQTTSQVELPTYFNSADLVNWRSRKIIGIMDPYNNRASGPAVDQAHMVTMVSRRLKRSTSPNNSNYQNKDSFYFTDSSIAYKNQQDWLAFLHPGMYLWTNKNVPEPFLAVEYFEDGGSQPTTTDVYNQEFIPFCTPLNTYNSSGVLLGQYIGYTAIFYFGMAFLKYPLPEFKPKDYYSPLATPPEVTPTFQFFSVDAHFFLVANPSTAGSLKSPKIGSSRHWVYNRDSTTWNIGDQYMYMLCGASATNWKFNVKFNYHAGGNEVILFNLSNFKTFVTP